MSNINHQRRFWLKATLGASLIALGTGCSRYEPVDDVTMIRMGVPDVTARLDPRYATDAFSTRIGRLIYPALIDFDKSSIPSPWIAKYWEWLDEVTLSVEINNNLVFHHGKPLTIDDVVATYHSVLDAKTVSPLKGPLRNLASVEAEEGRVVFRWHKPDKLALFRLTLPIMPADLLASRHNFDEQPIGCGGCRFVSYEDQMLVLVRQDGVKLAFVGVKDASVRLLKLVRNELDVLQNDLSPELVHHARSRSSIQVNTSVGTSFSYIGFNLGDPILSQLPVRQAIAHAINRPLIIKRLLDDMARMGEGIFPSEHWCGLPSSVAGYDYHPEKARQLLADAGFKFGSISLTYKTSTDPTRVRLATVYQSLLADVGINLSIDSHDWGTFYSDIKQGRFQLYGLAWVGVKSPEIFEYAFASYSTPPTGANRGHYVDTQFDNMLKRALIAPSMPEMSSAYKQIQQHLLNELPIMPLWHDHQVSVTRPNIKDYHLASDGRYDALLLTRKLAS